MILERLSRAAVPLATLDDGSPIELPRPGHSADAAFGDLFARTARVTEAGHAVLARTADHVALNDVDRWLGGIHLGGGDDPWRWDADAGRVVQRSAH